MIRCHRQPLLPVMLRQRPSLTGQADGCRPRAQAAASRDDSGTAAAASRKWGSGWGPSKGLSKGGRAAKDPAGKQQPMTETSLPPSPPSQVLPSEMRPNTVPTITLGGHDAGSSVARPFHPPGADELPADLPRPADLSQDLPVDPPARLPAQLRLARRIMKELAAFFVEVKYTNACVGMSMMLHEELQVG